MRVEPPPNEPRLSGVEGKGVGEVQASSVFSSGLVGEDALGACGTLDHFGKGCKRTRN